MSIAIPDDLLHAAHMSDGEIKQEFALFLFQRDKLTLGQASRFAGMSHLEFQHLLASQHIPVHYGIQDLDDDIETLRGLGRT